MASAPRALHVGLFLFLVSTLLSSIPTRFAAAQDSAPQSPVLDVDQLLVQHLSIAEGLVSRSVWALTQDDLGYMWIGTLEGLVRYDGVDFLVYTYNPDDPNTISNNAVIALYQDTQGYLWIGTFDGGLNRFDPRTEQFTRFQNDPENPQSLSHDHVNVIYQDRSGTLWIGTSGGGLNRFDPATEAFTRYQHDPNDPNSLSNDNIYDLYEDSLNNLWIPTYGGGLDLLDRQTGVFTHYRNDPDDEDSLSNDNAYTIYEDSENNLWIGTWGGGLNRFDREQGKFIRYPADPQDATTLSSVNIDDMLEDPAGNLWVATYNGLNRLDKATGKFVRYPFGMVDPNYPNRLSDSRIRRLYLNSEGQLWIATEGGGVNIIDLYRKPFLRYRNDPANPNSLSPGNMRAVYQDPEGIVWVGTIAGGLNRFDPRTKEVIRYTHDPDDPNSLVDNTVYVIEEDPAGMLWLGTQNGVSRFDPKTQTFVNYQHDPDNSNSLIDNNVVSLLVSRSDGIWFATWGGLDQFDPQTGTFTHYTYDAANPSGLSSNVLVFIDQDSTGALWIATEGNGLNRLDPQTGTFQHLKSDRNDPNTVSDNTIVSMYEDEAGILWFGGFTSGLNKYDPATNQFTRYDTRDGLPDNRVNCILGDHQNRLWIATGRFWTRFDVQTATFTVYDKTDGLPVNGTAPRTCFGNPDSQVFFGSMEGLVVFSPQDIVERPSLAPVSITDIQLDHAPVSIGADAPLQQSIRYADKVEVPAGTKTLSLTFAALNYKSASQNQYRYMLSGFDKGWTTVDSSHRFAMYTNLEPGEYEFRVMVSNGDGIWVPAERMLKISMLPMWWQTSWFIIAMGLASAAVLLVGFRIRTTTIRARNRELEQQVTRRTSELTTLLNVSQNIGSTLDLKPLLELILEQLTSVIDYAGASIQTVEGDQLSLQAVKQRQPAPYNYAAVQERALADYPTLNTVITTQQPIYIADLLTGGRDMVETSATRLSVSPETMLQSRRSWLGLPVLYEGRVLGVLTITHWQPNAFSPDEQRLAQAFAHYVAYAIANAQYHEQSQREVLTAERLYITREMHDSLSQTLFAANATALGLARVIDPGNQAAKTGIEDLVSLTTQAQLEMRELLTELRSHSRNPVRVDDTLTQLCEGFRARWSGTLTLDIQDISVFQSEIRHTYYFIAQEALSNIEKHAHADTVSVKLSVIGGYLTLEISDNGDGFDPAIPVPGHFGQGIMRERAQMIGAELEVYSQPGSGTKLTLRCKPEDVQHSEG